MKRCDGPSRIEPLAEVGRELTRALRRVAKRQAFTAIAVATLGIGIGASTATFSIADAILRQPLPVHEERGLSVLWGVDRAVLSRRVPLPYGAFKGFVDASPRSLVDVAALDYHGAGSNPVREGTGGSKLKVAFVTGNLFRVLGVQPVLGRALRPEDDGVAAAPVVAISHELWQRRYAAEPSVLGRVLTFRGQAATIVGVMPRGFAFPAQTEVWATVRPFIAVAETGHPNFYVHLVGRLAPGATVQQTASELDTYLRNNDAMLPPMLRGMTAVADRFDDYLLGDVRPVIQVLLAASALVMLVAIVNVGALFLTLGLTRQQELAIRASLGAAPGRLLMLALSEASIVAFAGAAAGITIAYAVVALVVRFASGQLPRADAVEINAGSLALAIALAIVATLAFAVSCMYGQQRADPARVLNAATRGGTGTRSARRTQRALVAAQVTLAVTIILGAGLVARSQVNLETLELGLAGDRTLVVQVVPPDQNDYADAKRYNANLDRIIAAIAPLPGVQGVAPTLNEPFGGLSGWDARYLLEGQAPEEQTRQPLVSFDIASPEYFRTFGITMLRGRAFTGEDVADGNPVLIVSESAARLAWPGREAVGQRMKVAGGPWATVVGVAADTRYRELTAVRPTVYRPRAQFEAMPHLLAIRTAGDPAALAAPIREAGQAAWPGAMFVSLRRLDSYSSEPLARPRVTAALFVGFAAVCLLLSTIGLYGVVTAHVAERTREVGIRMALGAQRSVVLRSVLAEGAIMTLGGIACGTAIAALSSRWLETMLYGVGRNDPATLAGVIVLVALVTGVATYLPARRAASIEPTRALRE